MPWEDWFWDCYYYLYDYCEDQLYDYWWDEPGRVKIEITCFWIGVAIIIYWSYIGVQDTRTPEYELSAMNTFYLDQDFDLWEEQGYEIVFEDPAPEECIYITEYYLPLPADLTHDGLTYDEVINITADFFNTILFG